MLNSLYEILLNVKMLKSKSIWCGNRNADFLFEYAIKVNVDYIEHYVVILYSH